MPRVNGGFNYRNCIPREWAGLTVLEYLSRSYTHSSRAVWTDRIRSGQVFLGAGVAACDTLLVEGQVLTWCRPPWREPEVPGSFAILFRDDHLLAVAKPGGLPTLPGGGFLEHTLLAFVRRSYPEAGALHRLGRGTSGIVLFGRTPLARSGLSRQWRSGGVVKQYRTLVTGVPSWSHCTIEVPIGPVRHPILGHVFGASPAGKPAASRVAVLERHKDASLVAVTIQTGRAHQIRIHLAAAGHPLLGDPLYARGGVPPADTRALPGDTGYILHAERLKFAHPAGGGQTEIFCLPPPPLRRRSNET